jgi:hypothetical protein
MANSSLGVLNSAVHQPAHLVGVGEQVLALHPVSMRQQLRTPQYRPAARRPQSNLAAERIYGIREPYIEGRPGPV